MVLMRVKQSFRAGVGGLSEGDLVPDSHPLVKAYGQFFEPAEEHVARLFPHLSGGVEQATAGPGEKRARTRPQPRAKKSDD